MIDSTKLEAFLGVVRHAGFSSAARALGKTQGAVSQAVLALERELGQPLFVREGRGVRLTEAGRILCEHAEQAASTLGLAEQRLRDLRGLRAGRLTIATSDTLAQYVLPSALRAFRARHPEVELRLEARPSPVVARLVARREADLGVLTVPLPDGARATDAGPRIERLFEQPEVAIVAPDHALARRKRIDLVELADQPLLLLGPGTAGRHYLEAQLARYGRTPQVVMEMNSVELLKRLAELEFGVAVVPRIAVAREVRAGGLCALELRGLTEKRWVALALPERDPVAPAALAFSELLRGRDGEPPGTR